MSSDLTPCGCEGHAVHVENCLYPALERAAIQAAAELRHAYNNNNQDWNLVARAISILERATTPVP